MEASISDREFHERAKSLKPDQVIKPTRYWVGILYHDKKTSDVSQEADFLWIKAHGVCSFHSYSKALYRRETLSLFHHASLISQTLLVEKKDISFVTINWARVRDLTIFLLFNAENYSSNYSGAILHQITY